MTSNTTACRRMIVVAAMALAVAPAVASAETYALDGKAVAEFPTGKSVTCAASLDADGVQQCYSSYSARDRAVAADLAAGKRPAGVGPGATQADFDQMKAAIDAKVDSQVPLPPGRAERSEKKAKRLYNSSTACPETDGGPTYVYEGGGGTQAEGYFWTTGNGNWVNHSPNFNNQISSWRNLSRSTTARWHDGSNGSGSYYGIGYPCQKDWDLRYSDLGDWNNRFSSYARW